MAQSLSPESRKAMQEILRYLTKHSEAGDTLQNIAYWWIPFEQLPPKWSVVEEAVDYLVAGGLLSETVLPGGKKFYSVIGDQRARIVQLLQEGLSQEES
jgi:hypothetical protein